MGKCEVCGAPACVRVVDVREVEPVPGDDGELWQKWEPAEKHAFCDEHRRPARAEYLPHRTVEEIIEMEGGLAARG